MNKISMKLGDPHDFLYYEFYTIFLLFYLMKTSRQIAICIQACKGSEIGAKRTSAMKKQSLNLCHMFFFMHSVNIGL